MTIFLVLLLNELTLYLVLSYIYLLFFVISTVSFCLCSIDTDIFYEYTDTGEHDKL